MVFSTGCLERIPYESSLKSLQHQLHVYFSSGSRGGSDSGLKDVRVKGRRV